MDDSADIGEPIEMKQMENEMRDREHKPGHKARTYYRFVETRSRPQKQNRESQIERTDIAH